MIAIAGDLIVGRIPGAETTVGNPSANRNYSVFRSSPYALYFLKNAVKIAPTYYSLGNHEWVLSDIDYHILKQIGIRLLDNTYERLPLSDSVFIGGMTSVSVLKLRNYYHKHPEHIGCYPVLNKRQPAVFPPTAWLHAFEQEGGFKLLLCHQPEYWTLRAPYLATFNIDLILAGHAHGGQIRLFDRGLYTPGEGIFPKYTSGLHRCNRSKLLISRGLSNTTWIPRIGNPPELVYVTLGQI